MGTVSRIFCALGLLILAGPAARADLTYNFSGTITDSDLAGIPVGTAFSGTFSYATVATQIFLGGNFARYATGAIDSTIPSTGLTDTSAEVVTGLSLVTLTTGDFAPADAFEIVNRNPTCTEASHCAITEIQLIFVYPVNTFTNLQLPSSIGIPLGAELDVFGTGYSARGPITFDPEPLPEPGSILLLATVLAAIAFRTAAVSRRF